MKKLVLFCCLAFILCLAACKTKEDSPTQPEETPVPTQTLPLDDLEILAPTETEAPATEPKPDEVLAIVDWGTYSGVYLEDGSDRNVENVPCLLIQNTTDRYLDYGVVYATVGDRDCSFVVTGLPGGRAAWVIEEKAQTMESGDTFSYGSQTVSQLRDLPTEERVTVSFQDGQIQVSNVSDTAFSGIRVYYKLLRSDGHYLGGITYTTGGQAIQPGQTVTLTAGHSSQSGCVLVRVDCTE